MDELQKLILLTTALAGMNIAGIKPKLKASELALLQFKVTKSIEEHGGEAEAETLFENALNEAVQQLYSDITKA
ncbi:hypothetical protein ACQKII_14065 [Lysinibacillus sp. NPDC048646]|uniref:hypothetical protein n=1 Tax=Lysinibacillus sp. NPDC048646 TaxID=3390574 RepID=UPI003D043FC7